jgi:hypothetical protein
MPKAGQEAAARPPAVPAPGGGAERVLRFASSLDTIDALVESFSHLVDERYLFIVTGNRLPEGLRCKFAVTLRDGTAALKGEAQVEESPARLPGTSATSGLRLRLLRLTRDSLAIHARMLEQRRQREARLADKLPLPPGPSSAEPPAARPAATIPPRNGAGVTAAAAPPVASPDEPARPQEQRVPPSPFVLPANPLSELSDRSLHGMVECAIHEDYGVPIDHGDLMTPLPEDPERASGPPDRRRRLTPPPEPVAVAEAAPPVAPVEPPPPQIIEVPGPPVTISVGVRGQILTALLAIALGFVGGYLVFGTDLIWKGRATVGSEPVRAAAIPTADEVAPVVRPAVSGDEGGAASAAGSGEPAVPALPSVASAEPAADEAAPPDALAEAAEPAPAGADEGCHLAFDNAPDQASVFLDGTLVGSGPALQLPVPCHQELVLALQHPRYRPLERRLTATPGEPLRVNAAMRRPDGQLTITSTPAGAVVTVNGKVVGRTPTVAEVNAYTSVHVTASLSGYKVWTKKVRVSRISDSVTVRLESIGP